VRAVAAESLLLKQQLLILNRGRTRSPRLRLRDRVLGGLRALFMRPRRSIRTAIVLKPSYLQGQSGTLAREFSSPMRKRW
jgi:hypothetical protein